MKKYRTLANNYIKRNAYANNTLGYYRKPIFIACISFIIIAICSLLIYQVTPIEKSERKKTVLCTMLLWDDKPIMTTKDEELTEKFNIYFFNTKVDVNNIEIITSINNQLIKDINQLRQAYGLCSHYLARTSIDCKNLQTSLKIKYGFNEMPDNMLPASALEGVILAMFAMEYSNNVKTSEMFKIEDIPVLARAFS